MKFYLITDDGIQGQFVFEFDSNSKKSRPLHRNDREGLSISYRAKDLKSKTREYWPITDKEESQARKNAWKVVERTLGCAVTHNKSLQLKPLPVMGEENLLNLPKDQYAFEGPSGGLTYALVAMFAFLSDEQKENLEKRHIFATGEIEVNGYVSPIGAIKHKILGVLEYISKSGITDAYFVYPIRNVEDSEGQEGFKTACEEIIKEYPDYELILKDVLKSIPISEFYEALRKTGINSDAKPIELFVGLKSWSYEHRDIFAGRDTAYNEIRDKFKTVADKSKGRLLLISGPNGSGKSSLAKAKILDDVISSPSDYFGVGVTSVLFPTYQDISIPTGTLITKDGLSSFIDSLLSFLTDKKLIELCFSTQPLMESVDDLVASLKKSLEDKPNTAVTFVLDQLEEIFFWDKEDKEHPDAAYFLGILHKLVEQCPRVLVIGTIRTEYVPKFEKVAEKGADLSLKNKAITQAIGNKLNWKDIENILKLLLEKGAQLTAIKDGNNNSLPKYGRYYEVDLLKQIVGDASKEPSPLPLIAFCLKEIYSRAETRKLESPNKPLILLKEDYDHFNGLQFISTKANKILDEILDQSDFAPSDLEINKKKLVSNFCKAFLEVAEERDQLTKHRISENNLNVFRQRYYADDKTGLKLFNQLIGGLEQSHLLFVDNKHYQIAHDALISWVVIQGWWDDNQDFNRWLTRTKQKAMRRHNNQDSLLNEDGLIAEAEKWAIARPIDIDVYADEQQTISVKEYVEESIQEFRHKQKQDKRVLEEKLEAEEKNSKDKSWWLKFAGLAVIGLIALSFLLGTQRNSALDKENRYLISNVIEANKKGDYDVALLLGLHAMPGEYGGYLRPEIQDKNPLIKAIIENTIESTIPIPEDMSLIKVTSDGRFAFFSNSNQDNLSLKIYDFESNSWLSLGRQTLKIDSLVVSKNETCAVLSSHGQLQAWNLIGPAKFSLPLTKKVDFMGWVGAGCQYIALIVNERTLVIWDIENEKIYKKVKLGERPKYVHFDSEIENAYIEIIESKGFYKLNVEAFYWDINNSVLSKIEIGNQLLGDNGLIKKSISPKGNWLVVPLELPNPDICQVNPISLVPLNRASNSPDKLQFNFVSFEQNGFRFLASKQEQLALHDSSGRILSTYKFNNKYSKCMTAMFIDDEKFALFYITESKTIAEVRSLHDGSIINTYNDIYFGKDVFDSFRKGVLLNIDHAPSKTMLVDLHSGLGHSLGPVGKGNIFIAAKAQKIFKERKSQGSKQVITYSGKAISRGDIVRVDRTAFSPDGKFFGLGGASRSAGGKVTVIDIPTKSIVFEENTSSIGDIKFSPDSKLVGHTFFDGIFPSKSIGGVEVSDIKTGETVGLALLKNGAISMDFSKDSLGFAVGYIDGVSYCSIDKTSNLNNTNCESIRIWTGGETNKCEENFTGHIYPRVQFISKSNRLLYNDACSVVLTSLTDKDNMIFPFKLGKRLAGFSTDVTSSYIAAWGKGSFKLWDIHTKEVLLEDSIDQKSISTIEFNPSSDIIALSLEGRNQSEVKLYSIASEEVIVSLEQKTKVNSIDFSENSRYLLLGSMGETRLFDIKQKKLIYPFWDGSVHHSSKFNSNSAYLSAGGSLWYVPFIFNDDSLYQSTINALPINRSRLNAFEKKSYYLD